MKKVAIIIVSLILAMAATACMPGAPTPPLPAPPESAPADFEVLELPTEARVGQYVTVKARVRQEEGSYQLYLWEPDPELGVFHCHLLGTAVPDDQGTLCWYVAIPTAFPYSDRKPMPGTYKLQILLKYWEEKHTAYGTQQGEQLLLRNIIIKE